MKKLISWMAVVVLSACAQIPMESAQDVIKRAQTAMGADKVSSLAFTASGTGATFGQAYAPSSPWPLINYSNFSRHYDYANNAMSEEAARTRAEPNGGGAIPHMGQGEQKTSGRLAGEFAWNMTPNLAAAPLAVNARVHDLWTSPHGALKAASHFGAVVRTVTVNGQAMTTLGFTAPGRFAAVVYINAQNLVAGVDSVMPNAVLGDTAISIWYDDYKDYGGIQFPSRIRQEAAGHPVLNVTVGDVKVNATLALSVPDSVRNFKENVVAAKAADTNGLGVWFLAGGSHNSVLIEMADHAVLVEAPLYDGRTGAVLAKAKELLPAKPVRYVVNSHHHFDHSGGIRTAAAQGAIVIASAAGKLFFDKALANPNRQNPDALAAATAAGQAKWSVEGVSGKRVMTSGSRTIEILEIKDSVHANGFLMVYLPAEKILIEADAFTPGPPNAAPPTKPNGNHLNLIANLKQGNLQVERILPLHGRIVPLSELHRAVGHQH